ncbi:MAG: helix-turn-helix domain-containing protein [Oscillospiraceae bacterium]|nr:helix-turn-helix domain-containing protein [Oscillospiraceae bacterium]MCL2278140.1 helix-turn-helix domain-containing protein [Oscillospiraceae bacterium]
MNVLFQKRLKECREDAKLSQASLAKKLGMRSGVVGNWESGIREPSLSLIEHIAHILEVSPSYLVGWELQHEPQKQINSNLLLKCTLSIEIEEGATE